MYPPDNPTRPCRPKAGQGLVIMMMMMVMVMMIVLVIMIVVCCYKERQGETAAIGDVNRKEEVTIILFQITIYGWI